MARRHFSQAEKINIADVGTGSGCIAVALAHELTNAEVLALDQSSAALEVARRNASRHGVDSRIQFLISNLLQKAENAENNSTFIPPLHMAVSNPPYVAETDHASVEREVREFEPHEAVFAGPSGREVYERLIPQAAQALIPGGCLALELGYDAEEWMRGQMIPPVWTEVQWRRDLAGITRVVTARRA
jgi:release factor glutamine methyltransferase